MTNPLLSGERVPAFGRIQPGDFMPAIDQALATLTEKIDSLRDNPAPATFANTVVPLESLLDEVTYIQTILGNLTDNAYTPELSDLRAEIDVRVAGFIKTLYQDRTLGARFDAVYQNRAALALDEDDRALLKATHQSFEASGALLSPAGQQAIRDIDAALINLATKFSQNMKGAPQQQAVLITDKTELAGLSGEIIEGFAENARKAGHAQGYLFVPERLLVDELLQKAEKSSFRKNIFESLNRLGTEEPYNNRPVIAEMQKLRCGYAQLLGYNNYAEFARTRAVTTDLPAVRRLLQDVQSRALAKFNDDMRGLEQFAAQNGGPAKLEPWDVSYWAERQRQALFGFDSNGFSRHLELENVMAGLFEEAGHLFNIGFRETPGRYPAMHPDIRSYEVFRKDTGAEVGILQVDMYARPETKTGGAWMNTIQTRDGARPGIILLNMNIPKPPDGKPALLALPQYITLYHEMGHCLQGLLGTEVKYKSQQGTPAPADFTEIHSMINERRATLDRNLKAHALNVDTGLPPSPEMLAALKASLSFFEAREILKLVQNSLRDLEFHTLAPEDYKGGQAIQDATAAPGPYDAHVRAYPFTRFTHLFDGAHTGYTAGYVNYLVAQIHAAHGFEPFENNPYDPVWSKRLSDLYNRGSGGDPAALYLKYRGEPATPDAMLRDAGIGPAP